MRDKRTKAELVEALSLAEQSVTYWNEEANTCRENEDAAQTRFQAMCVLSPIIFAAGVLVGTFL